MMRKLLPLLLGLLGLGIGLGAGWFLRPAPDPATEVHEVAEVEPEPTTPPEYVKLNNQFIVPVMEDGLVVSMLILSLSLEVAEGSTETVYTYEPKLRDVFLQVLFDHANSGGFRGSFTDSANLVLLRKALREAAVTVLGKDIKDVLIADITRQDS